MKKILFASNNSHKLEEVNTILNQVNVSAYLLRDITSEFEIKETGNSYKENATIKAKYCFDKFGLECFGEDSGLAIDILDGAPGIYSARYAKMKNSKLSNIDLVLSEMEGIANRSAKFVSHIVYIKNGQIFHFEGQIEGHIANNILGDGGFGYDPIFIPRNYSYSFAQLPRITKLYISHRTSALKKMIWKW